MNWGKRKKKRRLWYCGVSGREKVRGRRADRAECKPVVIERGYADKAAERRGVVVADRIGKDET